MLQTNTRALARPQHPFDLPAFTVWGLAGLGTGLLRLAHAADASLEGRRNLRAEEAQRPRARLGPPRSTHAEFGATDAWRLR